MTGPSTDTVVQRKEQSGASTDQDASKARVTPKEESSRPKRSQPPIRDPIPDFPGREQVFKIDKPDNGASDSKSS
ncbi:unnamed protein product [Fusarium fujikuroi]|nr:Uncharacterized protein Y057_5071 [Fusarium fujikuroi]QGI87163.1 hypothetical protein CEK25_002119 [Fusarium fujikuroi]SCV49978.1 uncharacterized protein FFFS_09280 [Fusarium fujikuroi]VZI00264.1 unnamed protein product [Fusarium fujikuroi]